MLLLDLPRVLWRFAADRTARLLRDLTRLVEGAAAEGVEPAELTRRLGEQLGRTPSVAELYTLLQVVEGMWGSLSLDAVPLASREALRTRLASYADGLRRDLGNATAH